MGLKRKFNGPTCLRALFETSSPVSRSSVAWIVQKAATPSSSATKWRLLLVSGVNIFRSKLSGVKWKEHMQECMVGSHRARFNFTQLCPIYPFLSSSFCFQAFIVIKRNGMKRYSPFLVGQVTAIRCLAPCRHFSVFLFSELTLQYASQSVLFTSGFLRDSRYDITSLPRPRPVIARSLTKIYRNFAQNTNFENL